MTDIVEVCVQQAVHNDVVTDVLPVTLSQAWMLRAATSASSVAACERYTSLWSHVYRRKPAAAPCQFRYCRCLCDQTKQTLYRASCKDSAAGQAMSSCLAIELAGLVQPVYSKHISTRPAPTWTSPATKLLAKTRQRRKLLLGQLRKEIAGRYLKEEAERHQRIVGRIVVRASANAIDRLVANLALGRSGHLAVAIFTAGGVAAHLKQMIEELSERWMFLRHMVFLQPRW